MKGVNIIKLMEKVDLAVNPGCWVSLPEERSIQRKKRRSGAEVLADLQVIEKK